jgi:tetratricopeptide (TPR) repeat protein
VQLQELHKLEITRYLSQLALVLIVILGTNHCIANNRVSKERTELITMSLQLHDELVRSDISKLKDLLDHLKINDVGRGPYGRAAQHRILGSYLMKSGKPESSIPHFAEALRYFLGSEDHSLASQIACDAGNACQLIGADRSARSYYLLSLELGKNSADASDAYNAYYGYARLVLSAGDTNYAESLLNKYILRAKQHSKYEALSDAYSILFMIYDARGEKDLARTQLQLSNKFAAKSDSPVHKSNLLINNGIVSFQDGETEEALVSFHEALSLRKSLNNNRLICDAFYNLGAAHLMLNHQDSANHYFNKSKLHALSNDLFPDARDAIAALIEASSADHQKDLYNKELLEIENMINLSDHNDYFIEIDRNKSEVSNRTFGMNLKGVWVISIALITLILIGILRREKIEN